MQVHAEPLRMRTNVEHFRVMRRLYRQEWNWLCVNQQTMTTDKGVTASDVILQLRIRQVILKHVILKSFFTSQIHVEQCRCPVTRPFSRHTIRNLCPVSSWDKCDILKHFDFYLCFGDKFFFVNRFPWATHPKYKKNRIKPTSLCISKCTQRWRKSGRFKEHDTQVKAKPYLKYIFFCFLLL